MLIRLFSRRLLAGAWNKLPTSAIRIIYRESMDSAGRRAVHRRGETAFVRLSVTERTARF